MKTFKTILMTAAMMAVPAAAFAQVGALKDVAKDKAVDAVMDNMTADDAMTAGKTLITGGSKEDAAMAVVKGRVDDKVDGMTGGVGVDDLSKDGLMDAGKEIAMDKAKGSATTFTDGVSVGGVSAGDVASGVGAVSSGGVVGAAKGSATSYAKDKAPSSAKTYGSAVISKSGATPSSATTYPAPAATTTALPPVNCPSGTTAQADGTCMVTGNWGG